MLNYLYELRIVSVLNYEGPVIRSDQICYLLAQLLLV